MNESTQREGNTSLIEGNAKSLVPFDIIPFNLHKILCLISMWTRHTL